MVIVRGEWRSRMLASKQARPLTECRGRGYGETFRISDERLLYREYGLFDDHFIFVATAEILVLVERSIHKNHFAFCRYRF